MIYFVKSMGHQRMATVWSKNLTGGTRRVVHGVVLPLQRARVGMLRAPSPLGSILWTLPTVGESTVQCTNIH